MQSNWSFNSIDRALIYELATSRFIEQHDDVLMLGNAGVGKSHLAQAIGLAAIHAGFRVLYREAHRLFEELVLATALGERPALIAKLTEVPLLIVDDLGMRKLPTSAAEDLLEVIMRRYERASTIVTSNRPIEDWPKLFGDTPAVTAFLDRLMHHSHLIEIRGKSYRLHGSRRTASSHRKTHRGPHRNSRQELSPPRLKPRGPEPEGENPDLANVSATNHFARTGTF